ncbi:methyl-accepting chemotaxis protein [Thalassotalea sp. PLHSN55]|uniref:methyl-accepting chemotaxis protein n=1 Tax=Thalassotalea sp. PLHSN55 TaxID=3435888 RepID=UPI003F8483EB
MLLQKQSLSIKLLLVVGGLLILMSLSFILISAISLNSAEKEIVSEVSNEVRTQIEQTVAAKSSAIAFDISNIFNESFVYPYQLANQISASIEGKLPEPYSRGQVEAMVSNTLSYSSVSSMYSQFDANKFDGRDSEFTEGFSHSVVGAGSLEVYFVREQNNNISQQPIENATDKYDETLDEFGNRAAQWYLCSKETLKACINNPYKYEIRPGYTELMTSLVVPVVADGTFRGVVGVDLNLPILQEKAKQLKASLYGGKASVLIVSNDGFLAAATEYEKSLARPIKEVLKRSNELLDISGQNKSIIIDNLLYFVRPIKINASGEAWNLIVGIDLKAAMLPVSEISAGIAEIISHIITSFLILAIISTVVALVLVNIFTKSIVKPVKAVADKMAELAGQGGDLTQELQVHSHAELISLSNAFNQFREKVRDLLEQAKMSGQAVLEQSEESKRNAEQTHGQISLQETEVNSIVTAITEMSATASEVANTASDAATNADAASHSIRGTESDVSLATNEITTLSNEMSTATDAVKAVSVRSEDIRKILDVISSIADQTNLLALNAAIEAARAGDHGRGFSVVADEVRALASKTSDSVDEISQVISSLQEEVSTTVSLIEQGTEKAQTAADKSNAAFLKMKETVSQIGEVTQHIIQIAAAAEEQSQVSEELNRNMVVVGDATKEVLSLSEASKQSAMIINKDVISLENALSKLKTN